MQPISLHPVGVVHSPFQEKFGIPRQSGLTRIESQIELFADRVEPEALRGLETCSHLWVVFCFHAIPEIAQARTVRPPRLGGNERIGVYATRSPYRPNRIGLSLVQRIDHSQLHIRIVGADLLDQTPILDLKPYVPYCDTPHEDAFHWAQSTPSPIKVYPSDDLRAQFDDNLALQAIWCQVEDYLRWDPRPAYRPIPDPQMYRQRFSDFEIEFRRDVDGIQVHSIHDPTTCP